MTDKGASYKRRLGRWQEVDKTDKKRLDSLLPYRG